MTVSSTNFFVDHANFVEADALSLSFAIAIREEAPLCLPPELVSAVWLVAFLVRLDKHALRGGIDRCQLDLNRFLLLGA